MKQFEFRLQKVMETTRTREELQKRELAVALAELDRNERLLEEMIDCLTEELEQFSGRRNSGSIKVSALVQCATYTDKVLDDIHRQRDDIEKVVKLVERNREKLLEITKDKKILEKLKEKRYKEYRRKLRQVEQKFMDELSARNFHNGDE
ncbi:MAG: flagellar export protein FliJ [Candidatus Glassbacteria bacterium]|nr:flagellar export protein FliJ [Candidatus Glassbacteria bacterium]